MRRRDHQPFAKTSAAGRLHCVRDTQDVSPGAWMTASRTDGEFLKILKTSTLFNKQMIETMNKYMTSLKQSPIHVLFTSRRFSVGRWWDGAGFLPSRVFKILRLGSPGSKLSWDRDMETYMYECHCSRWLRYCQWFHVHKRHEDIHLCKSRGIFLSAKGNSMEISVTLRNGILERGEVGNSIYVFFFFGGGGCFATFELGTWIDSLKSTKYLPCT